MIITTSNHVGTHLDGPQHFDTGGRDIASLEMEKLVGPGVVVDISDIAEDWSIYTPQDLMDRADIRKRRHHLHLHGLPQIFIRW